MTKNMAERHCVACEAGTPPLSMEKAREMMEQVPGWTLHEEATGDARSVPKLERALRLKDFAAAMLFVNRVAEVAEQEGHHPDIYISWNRVRLELTTHAIKGLSENDFIMASKINLLVDGPPI